MRVYLHPATHRFISTVVLLASLGLFGFALWKAVDLWQADPHLQQLQQLMHRKQS